MDTPPPPPGRPVRSLALDFDLCFAASCRGLASCLRSCTALQESALCAVHAVNSLLQGPFFTAQDLAEVCCACTAWATIYRYKHMRSCQLFRSLKHDPD